MMAVRIDRFARLAPHRRWRLEHFQHVTSTAWQFDNTWSYPGRVKIADDFAAWLKSLDALGQLEESSEFHIMMAVRESFPPLVSEIIPDGLCCT